MVGSWLVPWLHQVCPGIYYVLFKHYTNNLYSDIFTFNIIQWWTWPQWALSYNRRKWTKLSGNSINPVKSEESKMKFARSGQETRSYFWNRTSRKIFSNFPGQESRIWTIKFPFQEDIKIWIQFPYPRAPCIFYNFLISKTQVQCKINYNFEAGVSSPILCSYAF